MYQYAADHNAVFDSPDWNVSWKVDVVNDCTRSAGACFESSTYIKAEINGGLSIVGTTLYFESFDKRLYAFDALTGQEIWSAPLSNVAMNTPIVANGVVIADGGGASRYVMDSSGNDVLGRPGGDTIHAFNAQTGAPLWQFETLGENMPAGLAALGSSPSFFFTNGDNHAYALDLLHGSLLWKVKTPGGGVMSSLTESDGMLYGSTGYGVGSWFYDKALKERNAFMTAHAGWTWAMRESDGQLLWLSDYGDGHATPAVADGSVFQESTVVGSWTDVNIRSSEVVALDARTGALRWRYVGAPATAISKGTNDDAIGGTYLNGMLYQTLPHGSQFAAFDGRTGAIVWKIATHAPVKMSSVVTGGRVYFGDTAGYLYVVRASDGAIEQAMKLASIFTTSAPVVVGRTLFIANGSSVYALRLEDLDRGSIPQQWD
jgi:eukaryotic-like serine/threonine-protein kinase